MALAKLATLMFHCLAGNEKMNTDVGTLVFTLAIPVFSLSKLSEIRQTNAFNVGHEHGQQKSTDSAYSSPAAHGSAYEMHQVPR